MGWTLRPVLSSVNRESFNGKLPPYPVFGLFLLSPPAYEWVSPCCIITSSQLRQSGASSSRYERLLLLLEAWPRGASIGMGQIEENGKSDTKKMYYHQIHFQSKKLHVDARQHFPHPWQQTTIISIVRPGVRGFWRPLSTAWMKRSPSLEILDVKTPDFWQCYNYFWKLSY